MMLFDFLFQSDVFIDFLDVEKNLAVVSYSVCNFEVSIIRNYMIVFVNKVRVCLK